MSAINTVAGLGEALQLAFVPSDPEAALAHWIKTIGAGPFFHNPHIVFDTMNYMGAPSPIDMSSWLGYWGDTQIEIIVQHNDAPSMYKDWRDQGHEGLQHIGMFLPKDGRDLLKAAGAVIVQDGTLGDASFFYADFGAGPGTIVEGMADSQLAQDVFGAMRAAARNWDGADPIRELAILL